MDKRDRSLQEWLNSINLGQYYQNFSSVGLEKLEDCLALDADFLNDIGISLLGHRKHILEHLPLINVDKYHEEMNRSKTVRMKKDSDDKDPVTPPPSSCKGAVTPPRKLTPPTGGVPLPYLSDKPLTKPTPTTPTTPPSLCGGAPVASPESTKLTPEPKSKKPVPKPRISKLKKKEAEQKGQVKSTMPAVSETNELQTNISGVTLSESMDSQMEALGSTLSPSSPVKKEFNSNFNVFNFEGTNLDFVPGTSVMIDKETMDEVYVNVSYEKDEPAEVVPTKEQADAIISVFDPLTIPKTESDSYEEIWNNGGIKNEEKSEWPQSVKTNTDISQQLGFTELSPFPPEDVAFDQDTGDGVYENVEFPSAQTPETFAAPPQVPPKIPSFKNNAPVLTSQFSDEFSPFKFNKSSSTVHSEKTVNMTGNGSDGDVSNTDSPENSFEMPPPNFPPPPLPSLQKTDIDTITTFDPLAPVNHQKNELTSLPRVPPRPSLSSAAQDSGYVNYPPQEQEDDGLPTYNEVMSESLEPPDSLALTPPKATSKAFNTSTLSTPGPDPFRGMDPFSESDFNLECEQFNLGASAFAVEQGFTSTPTKETGATNYELAGPISDEQDFDPFGLNRGSSQSSSVTHGKSKWSDGENPYSLNDVPPPPHWNEAIEDRTSVYSVARHLNCSSDEDTSDSDIFALDDPPDPPQAMDLPPDSSVILSSSSVAAKKPERTGYLYKQGGVKGNKGWRKRWVIFNGKDLRYYVSSKSQVSKRIVPVTCMKSVKEAVKGSDTSRFKFNLETKNRTFQFAADTLDDCVLWCNTLMAAIVKHQHQPATPNRPGGDMYQPDKQGFIKFEKGRSKKYAALKDGKMCYYKNEQDFNIASPIHEIEMKLASVKEVERSSLGNSGKYKLRLSTHYGHFYLLFDNYNECSLWRMYIEEAIADGLGDNTILDKIRENPSNQNCADCNMEDPHWASINLGVVLCKKCAGVHRNFDLRLSKVRSLRMDISVWSPSLVQLMIQIGNFNANQFWEKNMDSKYRINKDTNDKLRKQHIENKYKAKKYYQPHPLVADQQAINMELLKAASTSDFLLTMSLIFSGADVLFKRPGTEDETAFQIAKMAGQSLQMELLYRNGGDLASRQIEDDEATATRRRAEICLQGYLQKTGSGKKEFLQRWCVIEHGCLRYYNNDKSSGANGSIGCDMMMCIQATPTNRSGIRLNKLNPKNIMDIAGSTKYPEAFELSTKQSQNRVYLFSASSCEEKLTWMRVLSKLICPVSLMDEMGQEHFTLAGNFHVREGLTSNWQKTWLMVNNKTLKYTDKDLRFVPDIDLRKAIKISYQESLPSSTSPGYVREEGKCFVLDLPGGRALYLKADLERDTTRLFKAIQAAKVGGDTLMDLPLTTDDIPIIVDKCIRFIEEHGQLEKGIYREAAQNSKVDLLLDDFAKDAQAVNLQLGQNSLHEVANALKRFLRKLKEPLLTSHLYSQWIQKSQLSDQSNKLHWYRHLIKELPVEHRMTLKRLVIHLGKLSRNSRHNLMTVENIAIAFGSTLMKAEQNQTAGNIQQEMHVVGDIIHNYEQLFEAEKAREEQMEIKQKDAEERFKHLMQNSQKRRSVMGKDPVMVAIHFIDHRSQSESYNVQVETTSESVVNHLKAKWNLSEGQWVIHEVLCGGKLERPLHPQEKLYSVIMAWGGWTDNYTRTVCLCLKPSDLTAKIDKHYDIMKPMFAELKFSVCKKKDFTKFHFDFKQMLLSYYKDAKMATQPINSWNAENLSIYVGADPEKKLPYKYAFTFLPQEEKMQPKDLFGYTVCMRDEEDMLNWVAALMRARHPTGWLS